MKGYIGHFSTFNYWNFSNKDSLSTVYIKKLSHLKESQYIDNQMAFFI